MTENGIIRTGGFTGEEAEVEGEDEGGEGVAGTVVEGGGSSFLFTSPGACTDGFFVVMEKLGKPAESTPNSLYNGVVLNTVSVDKDEHTD